VSGSTPSEPGSGKPDLRPGRIDMTTRFMLFFRLVVSVAMIAISSAVLADESREHCDGPREVREAATDSIQAFVNGRDMTVLTFAGYSGAGYEDPAAMQKQAADILDAQDPAKTLINIGATAVGIGAVYEIAKQKGFTTMGIVSSLAREEDVALSDCVDYVFYVADSTWGGEIPGRNRLAPTSTTIVDVSASFVAIGGGDVARDEMLAARRAGKPVTFIPADMNHELARTKAQQKGAPVPTDFRGAAAAALAPN
jgi:hypothetical protein